RYVSYVMGPFLEDMGQVIIPTGVIEVTRSPRNGEAGVARVIKMFGSVQANQRLIPYDSAALAVTGRPSPVAGGAEGTIRWIHQEPVLPSLQRYIVLTLTSTDGVKIGDEVALYQPRRTSKE